MLVLAGTELIFLAVAGMGLFWICAENCVCKAEMFSLLWSSAYEVTRPPLPLSPLLQRGWACTNFLTFVLPVPSHVLPGVSEQVMLSCQLGLCHNVH